MRHNPDKRMLISENPVKVLVLNELDETGVIELRKCICAPEISSLQPGSCNYWAWNYNNI